MRPKIIAEIGCNHKGSIDIAKEMVVIAKKFCNVDIVKFQKRNPRELLDEVEYKTPHPIKTNSYGDTYGKHREFLELSLDDHIELKNLCENINIEYSSSVWDVSSAKDIISINPKFIKIPSACNMDMELLELICKEYSGQIHLSFGMTTHDEEKKIINFFEKHNRNNDLVIYSCTSGYPVAFKDVCIKEISRLKKSYEKKVHSIGFSGHHLGIAVDLGAFMLGAKWIERHFTLDRTWKGTDHAASLEPGGMRKLIRDLESLNESLKIKNNEILEIELPQRMKLKKIKWRK